MNSIKKDVNQVPIFCCRNWRSLADLINRLMSGSIIDHRSLLDIRPISDLNRLTVKVNDWPQEESGPNVSDQRTCLDAQHGDGYHAREVIIQYFNSVLPPPYFYSILLCYTYHWQGSSQNSTCSFNVYSFIRYEEPLVWKSREAFKVLLSL